MRPLPSTAGLQAFEAAARHLSFTLAAHELHVSQGAISRRVRQIEGDLGVALFERMTRRIVLTQAGHELFASARYILGEFTDVVERLGRTGRSDSLMVSSLPTVAAEWLMPRLHEFTQRDEHVDVRITTSIEPASFGPEGPHAAIRVGRLPGGNQSQDGPRIDLQMTADWSGLEADYLFADRMLPICTRALLGGRTVPLSPHELLDYPLIHTTSRGHAWSDWLRHHGAGASPARDETLEFGHFFMSLQAARMGRGIALIPDIVLAHSSMDELMCPVRPTTASSGDYFLLIPTRFAENLMVASFRQWLLGEALQARNAVAERFAWKHPLQISP